MNNSWLETQQRLKIWEKQNPPSAWQLRRILADSVYFRLIAMCAAHRAPNRPSSVAWQDWWAFHLEHLAENEAIELLLDVWNKDIWQYLQREAQDSADEVIVLARQKVSLNMEFSKILENLCVQTENQILQQDLSDSESLHPKLLSHTPKNLLPAPPAPQNKNEPPLDEARPE